jgi:hypothetical protein
MNVDLHSAARALGGEVRNGAVVAPGPNNSPKDRSMRVRFGAEFPGGFAVDCLAKRKPTDWKDAKDYVRQRCGIEAFKPNGGAGEHRPHVERRAPKSDDGEIVTPIPHDAPPAPATHPKLGKPTMRWAYRNATGSTLFDVLRFNLPDDGKSFLPLTLWRQSDGSLLWKWKGAPPLRPLYGLDRLAARPDAPVIVCEGEKSADAAERLAPDHVAITSPNGNACAKYADWSTIAGRSVVIWPDADSAGDIYAKAAADLALAAGAKSVAIVTPPAGVSKGWDAADALEEGWTQEQAAALIASAAVYAPEKAETTQEPPRPLRRRPSPGEAFPIAALGDVLGGAARAILDKVQCPDAIAVNSVLGAASMATQALADVVLPATGRARPLSLFIATVAASGERKSEADHEALWPIRKHEEALRESYEAEIVDYRRAKRAYDAAASRAEKAKGGRDDIEAALRSLGDEPQAPLLPVLTCDSPTIEGLHKLYQNGHPSLGLFSDEGGTFIAGHAMAEENRLRTIAGLSSLWDGAPIRRVRSVDGAVVLPGRRLALHLMAQPDAAARMLSDPVLLDQGFTSRLLVAAPVSTAGTRLQHKLQPETEPALRRYGARLLDILETPLTMAPGTRNALEPRRLEFDPCAANCWTQFADYVEKLLGAGGKLEPVRGFANKLPEHAARIAAVLTMIDDPRATAIGADALERAITIADYYTTEALRLFEAGSCSPELRQAEKLLDWIKTSWTEPLVSLAAIYQLGPNSIRDKAAAAKAVSILEDHGWLRRHDKPQPVVRGKVVREAWSIVKEG